MNVATAIADWKPNESLTPLDAAFPANVSHLMPDYTDIPEDFKRDYGPAKKWRDFQSAWFFCGLKNLEATAKEGIDKNKALMHLGCIQGSFAPKHEHKEAAVAYLASLWFDDVKYERDKNA